jgi:hypothetical protein
MKKAGLIFLIAILVAGAVLAQRRSRGGGRGGESYVPDDARTAREVESHSVGTPMWTNAPGFEKDVFTFARIRRERTSGSGGSWTTDTPDSDLNLSFRLQQLTSINVDPNGRYLSLTDKDLPDYPFIYMVEPGTLYLDDEEVLALRKYLLNGGFLWLDDFWGEEEWRRVEEVLDEVFPDRKFAELPLEHPLYNCVFPIKSKGQVPNYGTGFDSQFNGGITWERYDAKEVHHRAIFDDKGRMMVFATHNTDNGDGWEREGETLRYAGRQGDEQYYFDNFSSKIAYPLAINVIFYVMTH